MALSLRHDRGVVAAINTSNPEEVARLVDMFRKSQKLNAFALGPKTTEGMPLGDAVRIADGSGFGSVCWDGEFKVFSHYGDDRLPRISLEFIEGLRGTGASGVIGFLDPDEPDEIVRQANGAGLTVIFSGTRLSSYVNAYENLGIRNFYVGHDKDHVFYLASSIEAVKTGEVTIWAVLPQEEADLLDKGYHVTIPENLGWVPNIQVILPAEFIAKKAQQMKDRQSEEAGIDNFSL